MFRLHLNQIRRCSNGNALIFQPVKMEHKSTIINFLHKYLFFDEPLSKSLKVFKRPDDLQEDWINMITMFIENDTVYKYEENGLLAGVWIHSKREKGKVRETFAEKFPIKNDRIRDMMELFQYVEKEADVHNYAKQDKLLFHECIGIHSAYRDKGLLKFLLWYSEKLAIAKGYRLMGAISTNAYYTRCCLGLGWQDVLKVNYKDYKKDGKAIFQVDAPHTEIGYYIKYL